MKDKKRYVKGIDPYDIESVPKPRKPRTLIDDDDEKETLINKGR